VGPNTCLTTCTGSLTTHLPPMYEDPNDLSPYPRQCKACPEGCTGCTSDTVCTGCSNGYEMVNTPADPANGNLVATDLCEKSGCGNAGGASAHAQTVANNCAVATCASPGAPGDPGYVAAECTQCIKDYYLDTKILIDNPNYKDLRCKAAGDTCYCDPNKPADNCAVGFWKDSRVSDATASTTDWSGVCTQCNQKDPITDVKPCTACTGPLIKDCTACIDGWFYDANQGCVKCHDNCLTCTGAGKEKCKECKKSTPGTTTGSYFLASGNADNNAKCYSGATDDKCPAGLYMKDAPFTDSNNVNLIAHTCE
jgi:hypothetical protein